MKDRMLKIIIFMVLVGFIVTSCSDNAVSERGAFYEGTSKNAVIDKTVNRTLMKVDNLSCGSCLATINEKLNTIEGVVGMGADLNRALVAVDHTKAIESGKIAEAITSIGYPAKVISVTEIDSRKAFADARSEQYRGGCCDGVAYSNPIVDRKDSNFSSYSAGCPYIESVRSRGCYASSSSWKELVDRFSKNPDKKKETKEPTQ